MESSEEFPIDVGVREVVPWLCNIHIIGVVRELGVNLDVMV